MQLTKLLAVFVDNILAGVVPIIIKFTLTADLSEANPASGLALFEHFPGIAA
jgi:hypothetical protein